MGLLGEKTAHAMRSRTILSLMKNQYMRYLHTKHQLS